MDLFALMDFVNSIKRIDHALLEFRIDFLFSPLFSSEVLYPFHIADGYTACIACAGGPTAG